MALDLRARGFDQFSVVDAGRTSRHAGHAAEAGIKVADPLRVDGRRAFAGDFHQIDAAARRIHFFVPQNVCRAHGQTKAAVDALIYDFCRGRMMGVKRV